VSIYNLEGISGNPKHHGLQAEERRRAQMSSLSYWQYIQMVIGIRGWVKLKLKVLYYLAMRPLIVFIHLSFKLLTLGRRPVKDKILLLSEHDRFGGVRTYFKQLIEQYAHMGKDVV